VLDKIAFHWQLEIRAADLCGEDVIVDVGTGCGKTLAFKKLAQSRCNFPGLQHGSLQLELLKEVQSCLCFAWLQIVWQLLALHCQNLTRNIKSPLLYKVQLLSTKIAENGLSMLAKHC